MSGGTKPLYLTEETMKIADSIANFSKWVQLKLTQHQMELEQPHKQTHRIKERARWDTLIDQCLEFVKRYHKSQKSWNERPRSTISLIEPWAEGNRKAIEMTDLTPEQFVQKVLARERDGSV